MPLCSTSDAFSSAVHCWLAVGLHKEAANVSINQPERWCLCSRPCLSVAYLRNGVRVLLEPAGPKWLITRPLCSLQCSVDWVFLPIICMQAAGQQHVKRSFERSERTSPGQMHLQLDLRA